MLLLLLLILCFLEALPEAFKLMKIAVMPQLDSAQMSAEVDPGFWNL